MASDTKTRTQSPQAGMADPSTTGKEVSRPNGPPPGQRQQISMKQERENARQSMIEAVEAAKGEISKFLAPFGIEFDFFLAGLKIALMRIMRDDASFFTEVRADSFMEELFKVAKDGLVADGKEAAIVQYKGKATYMPMRDGFVKVLWRTGMIRDLNDNVVTRSEWDSNAFDYEEGDQGYIRHRKDLDRKPTDEVVAAYCAINLVNGGKIIEIVPKADLEKIAATSKTDKVRKEWAMEMHRKAAIRRAMKRMPRQAAIAQLLEHDDANYDLNRPSATRPQPVPRAALFSDKAHTKKAGDEAGKKPDADDQAPAATDDQIDEGAAGGGEIPKANPAVMDAVSAIMASTTLGELATAMHDASQNCPSDEITEAEREWLADTIEKQKAKLTPPPEGEEQGEASNGEADQPELEIGGGDDVPALVAILSTQAGEKVYEDPAIWMSDILSKMQTLSGPPLAAFWKVNRSFVERARYRGHTHQAHRIFAIAIERKIEEKPDA